MCFLGFDFATSTFEHTVRTFNHTNNFVKHISHRLGGINITKRNNSAKYTKMNTTLLKLNFMVNFQPVGSDSFTAAECCANNNYT